MLKFIKFPLFIYLLIFAPTCFSLTQTNTVAIVGAGPSGLAAAKSAKEAGLDVTVFEKNKDIGGLLNPNFGIRLNNLNSNLSKFTRSFSDFPWPKEAPLIPSPIQLHNYFRSYCDHFNLNTNILLNTLVTDISLDELSKKWTVSYVTPSSKKLKKQTFDFVIIASGSNSVAKYPNLTISDFEGEVCHAKFYEGASDYKDKIVAIVGSGFSSVEVASSLYSEAKKVYHFAKNNLWLSPKALSISNKKTPIDLVFFRNCIKNSLPKELICSDEIHTSRITHQDVLPFLHLDLNTASNPTIMVISDIYANLINSKQVTIVTDPVRSLYKNTIICDHSTYHVDAIIFCTGFLSNFPFFSQDILKKINFNPTSDTHTLHLYESMFHPNLPNLAFVGFEKNSYSGIVELQARWAILSFILPDIFLPKAETLKKALSDSKNQIVSKDSIKTFYANYVSRLKFLAKSIGVDPDFDDPKLKNCPLIPAIFRLKGSYATPEIAKETINQCLEYLNKPQLD